jgi:hypothetical protein
MQSGMLVNIIHAKGVQNVAARQQMCHLTQNELSKHSNHLQERPDQFDVRQIGDEVSRCRSAVVECFCQAKPDCLSIAPKEFRNEDRPMVATLQILGVYRLNVTRKIFAAQLRMYGDEDLCRNHFSSVVLIEAVINDPTESFDLTDVKQPNPSFTQGSAQVPWDEGLLSSDGESLIARKLGCVKGLGPLRFAFYMHFWDPALPLKWTHGEIVCPPPEQMPVRVKNLMPYNPCD